MLHKYFPCPEFFQDFFKKFFSLIVSVKMIMLHQCMILLWLGKITADHFRDIYIAVAAAKVGEIAVLIYRDKKREKDVEK